MRQDAQVVGSKVRETIEIWAVPQGSLVLEKNLKEFERLKNLEVSAFEGVAFTYHCSMGVSQAPFKMKIPQEKCCVERCSP